MLEHWQGLDDSGECRVMRIHPHPRPMVSDSPKSPHFPAKQQKVCAHFAMSKAVKTYHNALRKLNFSNENSGRMRVQSVVRITAVCDDRGRARRGEAANRVSRATNGTFQLGAPARHGLGRDGGRRGVPPDRARHTSGGGRAGRHRMRRGSASGGGRREAPPDRARQCLAPTLLRNRPLARRGVRWRAASRGGP